MYPDFNQKRYEQLVKENEEIVKTGKTNLITNEVLDLWDAKQLFLNSELNKFKIYQN